MERKIKQLYHKDNAAILFMLAALWAVLIFAMTEIISIVPDRTTGILVTVIGILAGSFATASCIAVLVHLRKNQTRLYTEEINSSPAGGDV